MEQTATNHRGPPRLVSVVVPVFNAAATLGEQLAAVERQDHRGEWEVVVADNGSTDGSRALAERWAARLAGRARVVDASVQRGAGRARNAGARAAAGDLLLFSDADDIVAPGWIAAMAAAAERADLVTGRFDADALNPGVARSWNDPPDTTLKPFKGFLSLFAGSNAGIWRDAFEQLGGFSETTRAGEDVCLGWRAQLAALRLAHAPAAVVHVRYRSDLASAFRQFYKYGQGDAWLYASYRRHGMPPSAMPEVMDKWRRLAADAPGAVSCPHRRGRWVQTLALCCGRAVGSARNRALYL